MTTPIATISLSRRDRGPIAWKHAKAGSSNLQGRSPSELQGARSFTYLCRPPHAMPWATTERAGEWATTSMREALPPKADGASRRGR